jgi:competence protein ComEA
MEEKESVSFQVRAQEFVKKNLLFISLVSAGVLFVGIGIFQYFKPQKSGIEFVNSEQNVKGASTQQAQISKISIDVEGSVQKPGVYSLPEGSRLQDALVISGGLSSNADRAYVSKKINLAQKLVDSAKIYIPAAGETSPVAVSSATSVSGVGLTAQSSSIVGINSASQSELEALPKIGPVTAAKIMSGRPYANVSELVSKKVIGQKTLDAIKDLISAE